ncbi:helix-turn-helix transcriptional regulator [Chromobacterium vaccinii]|nr:helix-turn-helix transcriptional regulator [Chromobacterium vaccinii]
MTTNRNGHPVRVARKQLGLNQKQLAERAGCSQVHICGLERGYWNASPELAKRIADALGIPAMDVLYPNK